MKKAIFIIVYLIGCFCSYEYTKYNLKKDLNNRWTVGDRTFAICLSAFSWLGVGGVAIQEELSADSDKPANW